MGKVLIDSIPNMTASYSWTIINLGYVLVSATRAGWEGGQKVKGEIWADAFLGGG